MSKTLVDNKEMTMSFTNRYKKYFELFLFNVFKHYGTLFVM